MAAWPRFPGTIPPAASGRDSLADMPDWGALRAEFPLLDRCIYFNACSLGPLPRSGRAALAKYGQDWDEQGTPVWFTTWLPLLERFRGRVAELLRAPAGSTADAAHAAGALCVIDGYQTCGCVPLDVEAMGCDAFVGGCLKWVSGGPGNAFLYVKPELIPQVRPRGTGWFASRDPFAFTLQELTFADDARRLETGTWAMACHYAGLAGLELVLEVGVDNIQERLRDLTDRILQRCDAAGVRTFTPREREQRCGIVTLECDRPEEVEAELHAAGVIVDSRPGRIRLSPHWCVTEQELERGIDLVIASLSPPGEQSERRG